MIKKQRSTNQIRLGTFVLGLFLVYLSAHWTILLEAIWYAWPTDAVPFSNVIVVIFFVGLINFLLRKFTPKIALNHAEMITLYIMMSISTGIANWNMLAAAIPISGHAFWYATPENEWQQLIWRHLPDWLTISDREILRDYYNGSSTFFDWKQIRGWSKPIIAWTAFSSAFFGSMILISVLLRKQWSEHERLTFPVTQMPMAMMDARSGFFRSRLMWLGFSIAGGIALINSLHFFFPQIPYIPVKRQHIDRFFTDLPWRAAMPMKISFYPFMIGLGFMMPLDLSFSVWFFYLLTRIELIAINATGIRIAPRFPFFHEQQFGAMFAVCGFYLWTGRHHFKNVIVELIRGGGKVDQNEAISYRWAVIGIAICFGFMVVFCVKMGMSAWFAIVYLLILFVMAIVITRIRAELGLPVHDFEGLDPKNNLPSIFGTRRLGPANLTASTLLRWAETGDLNPHPMPYQLEGFKMIDQAKGDRRRFMIAMLIAVVASCFLTFITSLWMYYEIGAKSSYLTRWYGNSPFTQLQRKISLPQDADLATVGAMGFGSVTASILTILRMRFIWWHLHTLGYILADSWATYNLWSCVMISWFLKLIILKQGGLKAYRSSLPFFWGLILGDFVIGGSWLAIGVLLDLRRIYVFYL